MIQPTNSSTSGKRDEKGRFLKGVSGNPGGNPYARKNALTEIAEAVDEFREQNGMSYWKAATLLALKLAKEDGNTTLLCKILDKFVANKIEIELPEEIKQTLPIVKLYVDGRN